MTNSEWEAATPECEKTGHASCRADPLMALDLLRRDMRVGFQGIHDRCDRLFALAAELRAILDRIERNVIEERRKTREWLDNLED